jgi:hypothetical protein
MLQKEEEEDKVLLLALEQELVRVQTIKKKTQDVINILLEDEKRLEAMVEKEKKLISKHSASGMSRLQMLQEKERQRQKELQDKIQKIQEKHAKEEEKKRKRQKNQLQTEDETTLDNLEEFLAQDAAYY